MAQPQSMQSAPTFLSRASRSETTGKISEFARYARKMRRKYYRCMCGPVLDNVKRDAQCERDHSRGKSKCMLALSQSTLPMLLS